MSRRKPPVAYTPCSRCGEEIGLSAWALRQLARPDVKVICGKCHTTSLEEQEEEYLDVSTGYRRHPVACTTCGELTHTPIFWDARSQKAGLPICDACFLVSLGLFDPRHGGERKRRAQSVSPAASAAEGQHPLQHGG
jgi:hypothetical protein